MFGQKKQIVGLDIGSHTLKAVVLDAGKSGMILKNMGVAHLPPDVIVEGVVENEKFVIGAIKNLLKSLKISLKNVCTSVSGYSVIIKKITIPSATREELSKNIEVEAEQFIPFDISEVNVDFQILGEKSGQADQMEVILAAAKKDIIDAYTNLIVNAGLKPEIIDVDVFALENAFTNTFPDVEDTIALIDIGANKMNINIIKEGASLMTKDSASGGARVTADIQEQLDVAYEEAEGIKLGAIEAEDMDAVRNIIGQAAEGWANESKRTIEYLETSYPNEKLKAVYLSGGSSRIEGLDRYFQQELGVPVRIFNPLQSIRIDEKKFDPDYVRYMGPQMAVCLGLALRRGE